MASAQTQDVLRDVLVDLSEMPIEDVRIRMSISRLPLDDFRLDEYNRVIDVYNEEGNKVGYLSLLSRRDLETEFGVKALQRFSPKATRIQIIVRSSGTSDIIIDGKLYQRN
ncbi:MAG: hypothetical protein RML37_08625 [Chitinophagales bacterium]|nr:hypothetical protein [Chitinophagales bacterium]